MLFYITRNVEHARKKGQKIFLLNKLDVYQYHSYLAIVDGSPVDPEWEKFHQKLFF